ncbi:MAG: hypothetical protein J0H53_25025 [Rhizobiales bacterium]|nr:hypothetical protein [Hyphomicrobiales bacterium]
MANLEISSGLPPRDAHSNPHSIEGRIVIRFDCPTHGFVGFNVPGTSVSCRFCRRPVYGAIVDLIFASEIKPLA